MQDLVDYIVKHTQRGPCQCGQCFDVDKDAKQPEGHTADLEFFKVSLVNDPDEATLEKLVRANKQGDFANVDVLDGKEHSYIELGAWIGDQGLALMLMGMGSLLELWTLLTPSALMPSLDKETRMALAARGLVAVKAA